jgi:hypothetical protein
VIECAVYILESMRLREKHVLYVLVHKILETWKGSISWRRHS